MTDKWPVAGGGGGQLCSRTQIQTDGKIADTQVNKRPTIPQQQQPPSFLRRLLNVWLRPPGAPVFFRPRSTPPVQDVIKKPAVDGSTKRETNRSVSFNGCATGGPSVQQKRNWTNGSRTLPHRPKPTAQGLVVVTLPYQREQQRQHRPFVNTVQAVSCCATTERARCSHVSTVSCSTSASMMPARSTPNLMPINYNVGGQHSQHVIRLQQQQAQVQQQQQQQRHHRAANNSKRPMTSSNPPSNHHQQMGQPQQQQSMYNAYLGHVKNVPPPLPPTLSRDVMGDNARRRDDADSPPPTPPVRDSSSLKSVKYGPGHEKFPSWPVPATADTPAALRMPPGGGSHRSKSWTDHTNYPKEQPPTYTRPYMRQHSSQTQQKLKTVLEKCEKIPADVYDAKTSAVHRYHNFDGDASPQQQQATMIAERGPKQHASAHRDQSLQYTVPSPPGHDLNDASIKLSTAIGTSSTNFAINAYDKQSSNKSAHPPPIIPYNPQQQSYNISADSNYEDKFDVAAHEDDDAVTLRSEEGGIIDIDNGGELNSLLILNVIGHQKQVSYAQSEGYHSYVSSTDSTGTPFLDRLRRDSEASPSSPTASLLTAPTQINTTHGQHRNSADYRDLRHSDHIAGSVSRCSTTMSRSASVVGAMTGGRDSVVTTSSGSASSSETLKWHGSMSDVSSIAGSFTTNHSTTSTHSTSPSTLNRPHPHNIAHSARVKTPQRHHSESVLYIQQQQTQQIVKQQQQTSSQTVQGGQQQLVLEQQQWKEKELRKNGRNNRELKLFAVNTYTVEERIVEKERREMVQVMTATVAVGGHARVPSSLDLPSTLNNSTVSATVADRVNEFEKQQRYSYLDPDKRHKIPDPTLKAIQKKALLSFYERRHSTTNTHNDKEQNTNSNISSNGQMTNGNSNWRSAPQLNGGLTTFTVPKLPARKVVQLPNRRASSASDYSKRSSLASLNLCKEASHNNPSLCSPTKQHSPPLSVKHHLFLQQKQPSLSFKSPSKRSSLSDNLPSSGTKLTVKHQHSSSCGSLSTDLLGPVILGPSISLDDWVPEQPPARPPKNPALRNAYLETSANVEQIAAQDKNPSEQHNSSLNCQNLAANNLKSILEPNHLQQYSSIINKSSNQSLIRAHSTSPPVQRTIKQRKDGSSPLSEEDDLVLPPPPPIVDLEGDLVDSDLPLPPPPTDLYADADSLVYNGCKEQSSGAIAGGQVESGGQKPDEGCRTNSSNLNSLGLNESTSAAFINQTIGLPEPPPYLPSKDKLHSTVRETPCNFTSSSNIRQRYSPPSQKLPQSVILSALTSNCQTVVSASASTVYNTSDLAVPNQDSVRLPLAMTSVRQSAMQRASMAITTGFDTSGTLDTHNRDVSFDGAPPPLQPRQMRFNQTMRPRISDQKVATAVGRANSKSKRSSTKENGKGNCPIMTPSKASYLASRRDRDRIVPDSDTGVYKRTISPNGHVITAITLPPDLSFNESTTSNNKMINTRETHWPNPNRLAKDATPSTTVTHKNHVNILRRVSMSKADDSPPHHQQPQLALPDVLPVNAKLLGPRLMLNRPSQQLSLVPSENDLLQLSPPTTQSPPLRNNLLRIEKRLSPPQIRPPLSPSSPKKLSPITRLSPNAPVKVLVSSITSSKELETSPDNNPLKVMDGQLQLIQRTEVVLRVNATTADASSQTEKADNSDGSGDVCSVGTSPTPVPTRKKLKEEIECEQLSQEFVEGLVIGPNSCDRLKGLLVPGPEHKKSTDYVSGLYRVDVTLRPRPANSPFRSKATTPSNSPPPSSTNSICTPCIATPSSMQPIAATTNTTTLTNSNCESSSAVPAILSSPGSIYTALSSSSAYFTTSEPKAKLLTRYSHDLNNQCNVIKDTKDLSQKKDELVTRLARKLSVLRCEHVLLQEECRINDALGEEVRAHVCTVARPHEAAKVRLHVDEVGRITSLLLGLSGRLARAENALMRLKDEDSNALDEKVILLSKRDKLREQLDEAKQLKACIDKRAIHVSNILYKYLTADEYADYDHYINMKAKLIMDGKEIVDNIQLGEEQLLALQETLIVAAD